MSPDQKNTPPETTIPNTPSPTRTTETPATTLLTSPASGMPKSSGSKKIIIIGIVVFLFLIAIVGALILLTNKDKSKNSSQSTTTTPSTETTKTSASVLESIRTGLAELNPTQTSLSNCGYRETTSGKSDTSVPSELCNNFAQQDATLIFSSITDVLKANGLTADKSRGEDNYSSDTVRCTAFANIYYGRVICVSVSRYKAYADQVPAITKAVENKLGFKTEAPFQVSFYEQLDGGKLVGATYATKKVGEDFFFPRVYLTSSDTKTWKYIAQNGEGRGAELPPDCSLFTKEEALLFEGAGAGC